MDLKTGLKDEECPKDAGKAGAEARPPGRGCASLGRVTPPGASPAPCAEPRPSGGLWRGCADALSYLLAAWIRTPGD